MITHLSGGLGYVYVEDRTSFLLGSWTLAYDNSQALQEKGGTGVAKITTTDPVWSLYRPSRIRLRLGSTWWVWTTVEVNVDGSSLQFTVTGAPILQPRLEESNEP